MIKLSIHFFIIGILLVGCSQNEQHETNASAVKSSFGTGLESLDLKEKNEIAIFNKAVSDSTKQSGIVNMTNPQYEFSLGKESYFLWIAEDNGTIMNAKDTHTIYSLTKSSVIEINGFVNKH